jgi:hypothetical protein
MTKAPAMAMAMANRKARAGFSRNISQATTVTTTGVVLDSTVALATEVKATA